MSSFTLRFWGVRGTCPMPGAETLRYGGNTSCVQVNCGGRTLILDAGTGIKALGDAMQEEEMDILLSHTHIDHIMGLPFFKPFYRAKHRVRLWQGNLQGKDNLQTVMDRLISPPTFPLTRSDFKADIQLNDFLAGDDLSPEHFANNGIIVRTFALNHPGIATAYRIEFGGKALCYITDNEHVHGQRDEALIRFVQGADCMIYDGTYDDADFPHVQGWGHSTWQEAVRVADAASVKTLVIFHHDPEATDDVLDARKQALEVMRPGSIIAQEQLEGILI